MQRSRHLAFAVAVAIVLVAAASGAVPAIASTRPPAAAAPVKTSTGHPSKEVFGFALGSSLANTSFGYPSWNFDLLSTVAYFGLHVDTAGRFVGDSGWSTWNSSDVTNLVTIAHQHGTKVVVTVILQDFSPNTPNMCAGLMHADATVAETVQEVKAKGVDGVNIDYEGLDGSCGQGDPYWAQHAMTAFVQKMRAGLGGTYYLSVDTYASSAADGYGFFDVVGIANYADSFFVMAYDLEYSNYARSPASCARFCLGPTGPLSAYYYNDTAVGAQYVAAVGAGKTILGVPYYGRKSCVGGAVPNAYPTSGVVADSYLDASSEASDPAVAAGSYASHRDAYSSGGERWDTWYNTSLGCTRELYWDDATSLGKKYDLVNSSGLRGVGLWNLNYGGGAPELWSALQSHFAMCTGATLSASKASPQPPGVVLTLTASATCPGTAQYRFWVRDLAGRWSIAQDYSATSTFSWNTAGRAPGSYGLEVDVRGAGSTAAYDTVANLTFTIYAPPCAKPTLSAAPASPQGTGTQVALTATTSACPTPTYRFYVQPPGGAWQVVRDYSTANTYTWPATGAAGGYRLEVDVRDQTSSASYEAYTDAAYQLNACASAALTTSAPPPEPAGTTITLSASSSCPGRPEYRFWTRAPGGAWKVAQDYSSAASYSWSTAGLADGVYGLEVDVRDQSATVSYEATTNTTFMVDACSNARLAVDKASPQPVGTTVNLTASATCLGTAEYRFWVRPPGGNWTIVQDYGPSATYAWSTAGKAAGTYGLEVDVRNHGSVDSYETVANLTYSLGVVACATPTLQASPASPQGAGTAVTLSATTSGCPYPRYRFWVAAPAGAWAIVQDYSPASSYVWKAPATMGTYRLEVDVRDQSSTSSYDHVANTTYVVGACSAAHLATDKASPQAAGTVVVLTGSASCPGTAQYRFWVRDLSGRWTIVQDYSASSTFSWNTAGLAKGVYGLEVDVRDQGATVSYETVANLTFTLT
jgi:spore germination protein YaaH